MAPGENRLLEVDYQGIAARLIRESAGIRPGERVTILGRADSLEFCEALELEILRLGALPFIVVGSDAALLAALSDPLVTEEALQTPSPQLLAALSASDLIISTFFERDNPSLFNPVPPARLDALRRSEELPGDIIFDGTRRWLGTEIPTPGQARALGCDWPILHNQFWKAMQADYNVIRQNALGVARLVEKGTTLRITGHGGKTDLLLETGGRPVEKDFGIFDREGTQLYLNMPSGEICFAPPEESANGRAFIELAYRQGQPIRNLELEFNRGLVRARRASQGLELFNETIARGGGDAARLGEFGLGLNPAIEKVTGFLLLDEKLLGTIHLALGENRPLGGINNSALHWDLVVQQATVELDGRVIMKDGKLFI